MRHPPSPIYESKSGRTTLSLVFTILITGGLFIILPLSQLSSEPTGPNENEKATCILIAPPPKPPDPPKPDEPEDKPDDKIELDAPIEKPSIRDVTDFYSGVRGTGDGGLTKNFLVPDIDIKNLIYEPEDLDSAPQALVQSAPVFPSALKRGHIEGFVEVVFVVTADGRVRDIRITKASHREFAESVNNSLRRWSFEPGKLANKAVATRVRQTFNFTLK
jgi:periplasmic protein TonB